MKKEKWKIVWQQNWTSTCLSLSVRSEPKTGKNIRAIFSPKSILAMFKRHLKKKTTRLQALSTI
jgi:hypothetical protein